MDVLTIKPITENDRPWIADVVREHWVSEVVVSRGKVHHPGGLPGFVAWKSGERFGLLTYRIEEAECEVVTLDSQREGLGIGTALINAAREAARSAGCTRLWLITTNDNLHALRFYQKRGFVIAAVHVNALAESRRLKPEIPLTGFDDIPLRDEIELEIRP